MRKFLSGVLLFIVVTLANCCVVADGQVELGCGLITRSIEHTDLVIEAPAKLQVGGLSVLNDVTIEGHLLVTGACRASEHFFLGEKLLNFPVAGIPTNVLTFTFNSSSMQLPLSVELLYFANVVTSGGKPQTGKRFFCKITVLLNSSAVLATLDKLVYVNGTKDGTASVTPTLVGNILKLSFAGYTTDNGTLFYNIWGVNVTGVS